ncbi:MAG: adenosylcobinamide-GDP ribazoletransferase, partial [Pseudomonadota bacterium]
VIIVTGALHEDGFADCADGFWGGSDPERRLAIMRDSRIGTYGVLALVGAVLLKAAALQTAVAASPGFAALTLLGGAAAARAVALYPFVALPPAREDGLAVAIGRPTVKRFREALIIAIIITAALTVWWAPLGFVVAGVATAAVVKAFSEVSERKIGGHTGDVIGASVVLADLTYIATLTMWTV